MELKKMLVPPYGWKRNVAMLGVLVFSGLAESVRIWSGWDHWWRGWGLFVMAYGFLRWFERLAEERGAEKQRGLAEEPGDEE